MWYTLSGQIPGPGRVPPPTTYQKSVHAEAYIAEQQRRLDLIIFRLKYLKGVYERMLKETPYWMVYPEPVDVAVRRMFRQRYLREILLKIQDGYVYIVYGRADQISEFKNLVRWYYENILKPWELYSLVERYRY